MKGSDRLNKNSNFKVKKIDNIKVPENANVRVKLTGNIMEVMYSVKQASGQIYIKKINSHEYVDLRTGEVFEYETIDNRSQNLDSVRRSLGRLRDYINTNVIDVTKCKWVTLTYAENMTDTKRLYKEFEKFVKKARYKYGNFEYIIACEPQGRGAWHIHMLMIFPCKAPYIPNNEMADIWSYGFTTTKKLDENISNIGAYLTAYLGDFDFADLDKLSSQELKKMQGKQIKDVEVLEPNGMKTPKKIIKGGRLHMYPANFNLYRCSRGIKKPAIFKDCEKEVQKIVKASHAGLTFEKTISISNTDTEFENILNYRYYNSIAECLQDL
jgi:hypothetical protein